MNYIVVIDGAHARISMERFERELSYRLLHSRLRKLLGTPMVAGDIFDAAKPNDDERVANWITDAAPFNVNSYVLGQKENAKTGKQGQIGVDVAMAMKVLEWCYERGTEFDGVVIWTGDSDFFPLVTTLRRKFQKRVVIFGDCAYRSHMYDKRSVDDAIDLQTEYMHLGRRFDYSEIDRKVVNRTHPSTNWQSTVDQLARIDHAIHGYDLMFGAKCACGHALYYHRKDPRFGLVKECHHGRFEIREACRCRRFQMQTATAKQLPQL